MLDYVHIFLCFLKLIEHGWGEAIFQWHKDYLPKHEMCYSSNNYRSALITEDYVANIFHNKS